MNEPADPLREAPPGVIADAPWARWIDPRWLRWHRYAFAAGFVALTATNIVTGGGWWAMWPVLGWGVVFFVHLCFVSAMHVDEDWVDERTDEIRMNSYDLGHIDSIEDRYNVLGARESASRRAKRTGARIEDRYPLVDAHHHLWDLERHRYPWLTEEPLVEGRHGDYRPIRQTYLPEHYRADWAGLNVLASVHVEAERDPTDSLAESAWLSELHAQTGLPNAIVAHARLASHGIADELAGHAAHPLVCGIRQKPAAAAGPEHVAIGAPGSMGDPAWRRGYALLAQHGFSFDLQTAYWHLPEAATLARDFPRTLIVVNHTGLPCHRERDGLAAWREAMEAAAAEPNVVLKISGLGEPHLAPWTPERHRRVVLEAIEIFGIDRCMFGSNYPVERLYAPFDTVMRGFLQIAVGFSLGDRRRLFHDNAARYYRIDLSAAARRRQA